MSDLSSAQEMADRDTIRAGWMIQLRAHGLILSEPLGLQLTLPISGREVNGIIEVAEHPTSPVLKVGLPLYGVRGYDVHARSEVPPGATEGDPPGAWLVVTVTADYPVPGGLTERFMAAPDATIDEVRAAISSEIREEMRPVADLAAGALALALIDARPSLWNDGAIYWHGANDYKANSVSSTAEMRLPTGFTEAQLLEVARQAGGAMLCSERTRRVLALCFRWLLVAHGLPHGSNERFVTVFQCLEALCGLVSSEPTESDAKGFDLLNALATRADNQELKRAREFLQSAKERLLKPSLAERFKRLAVQYSPATAEEDVRRFREVRGARNDLLHARIAEIGGLRGDVSPHDAAHELAVHYLAAVVGHETEKLKHELVVTRGARDASACADQETDKSPALGHVASVTDSPPTI